MPGLLHMHASILWLPQFATRTSQTKLIQQGMPKSPSFITLLKTLLQRQLFVLSSAAASIHLKMQLLSISKMFMARIANSLVIVQRQLSMKIWIKSIRGGNLWNHKKETLNEGESWHWYFTLLSYICCFDVNFILWETVIFAILWALHVVCNLKLPI